MSSIKVLTIQESLPSLKSGRTNRLLITIAVCPTSKNTSKSWRRNWWNHNSLLYTKKFCLSYKDGLFRTENPPCAFGGFESQCRIGFFEAQASFKFMGQFLPSHPGRPQSEDAKGRGALAKQAGSKNLAAMAALR